MMTSQNTSQEAGMYNATVGTSVDGERAWLYDQHSYNASGHQAHRHDGSSCFGYQVGGCPGCERERALAAAA